MRLKSTALLASAGLAFLLAGCASNEARPPVSPAASSVTPIAAALAPAVYMQLAASSSLFAVRASELAAERSNDSRLRDLARTIAQDQRGVGSQLNFAGRRLDLLPSATLTDAQAADLERLRNSADVSRTYRQILDPVLARAAHAHASFAARGTSATLRPVARMAAPATRRNLQQLRAR